MQSPLAANVHVLLLRGNEILLLRRFDRAGVEGPFDLVSSPLDGGETVSQAALRTAFEEVGVTLSADRMRVAGVMHRLCMAEHLPTGEYIDFFVAATEWSDEPRNRQPERCSEMRWFSLDALPRTIEPFIHAAIENYRRKVFYGEFGWESS